MEHESIMGWLEDDVQNLHDPELLSLFQRWRNLVSEAQALHANDRALPDKLAQLRSALKDIMAYSNVRQIKLADRRNAS